jgi:hypothetical protein
LRLGKDKGFDEILGDPFFKGYDQDEILLYMGGKDIYTTSFKDILSEFDVYLEDACKLIIVLCN